ncbi:hypothetical protein K445DRAFT_31403, partial [Daldinia sp. EC12]
PTAAPLQPSSPDKVNQLREAAPLSPTKSDQLRDSDVHDKIRQFNNLAHTNPAAAASMSRQLERKTADAALKRAMLGREEAEAEMRRYREEARALRRQVEESRGRERKVGERLEDVMEKYGQAKETLQHSKTIWEKEIRHARKEVFKTQSTIVKLQEELKVTRNSCKSVEESLAREKELSKAREQEAFKSRYQLAEVQEQLEKALERITFVEQERDAYKDAAKSEEIARIAAEGRLPLPPEDPDSEFASPKKERASLSAVDILSSAASEEEIEELTRLWQWEKQRADRTQEHLEFVQAECQLRCCSCAKSRSRRSMATSVLDDVKQEEAPRERKGPRRSTIFVPSEGIFRTISQQDLHAIEKSEESPCEPTTPKDPPPNHSFYSRTPSVEPPTFALLAQERTSLLSLLNAPHESDSNYPMMDIPTMPLEAHNRSDSEEDAEEASAQPKADMEADQDTRPHSTTAFYTVTTTTTVPIREPPNNNNQNQNRVPSFDVNNPNMAPTMTREEALAQIRERRGRARSAAQGLATPRRQMISGTGDRRDVSAPAARAAKGRS